jgi:hypothetical protein
VDPGTFKFCLFELFDTKLRNGGGRFDMDVVAEAVHDNGDEWDRIGTDLEEILGE